MHKDVWCSFLAPSIWSELTPNGGSFSMNLHHTVEIEFTPNGGNSHQ
jgi:hypothetical protein